MNEYDIFLESGDLLEMVENFMQESSTYSKLKLPGKIAKFNKSKGVSIHSMTDLIINHYNPGLREIIKTSNDIDELKYLREDTRTIFPTLEKIKERIKLCKELGDCNKTKNYYKGIKEMYIDKGITEKDVQKTIDEMHKDIDLINNKIKELKKKEK